MASGESHGERADELGYGRRAGDDGRRAVTDAVAGSMTAGASSPVRVTGDRIGDDRVTGDETSTGPAAASGERVPESFDKSGTDLPLPLRGSGGSVPVRCVRCPYELCAAAGAGLPSPPVERVSLAAVEQWLAAVAETTAFRRHARALAMEVRRVLWADAVDRHRAEVLRRRVDRDAARRRALADGSWAARREAGRRAQRPVRVDVDAAAWERFVLRVRARGSTVGIVLGRLVASTPCGADACEGRSVRRVVFVRIAIDDVEWASARERAAAAGVTIGRFVGLVVEADSVA